MLTSNEKYKFTEDDIKSILSKLSNVKYSYITDCGELLVVMFKDGSVNAYRQHEFPIMKLSPQK